MDKGVVLTQLKDALVKRDYHNWNMVSVNMIELILQDETNCEETREVASQLFDEYKEWTSMRFESSQTENMQFDSLCIIS